jgi:hypothetical protein
MAAALSLIAISTMAWRVSRLDLDEPGRLIGQLRVAQWAAVLLAGLGGISLGLAVASPAVPLSHVDAALGVVFVGFAGIVLQRDPRDALLFAAGGFAVHALLNLAHRPGWLPPELAPRWYIVGSAIYDVCVAGTCYWTARLTGGRSS